MAETHVNFLSGSPLNRLSWLRTSSPFLTAVLASQRSRWVLFRGGEPLVRIDATKKSQSLAKLSTSIISPLLGSSPIFGQGKKPGQAAQAVDDSGEEDLHVQAARLHGPKIVFLGVHELENAQDDNSKALPSSEFSAKTDPRVAASNISGIPYFSLDVSDSDEDALDEVLKGASHSNELDADQAPSSISTSSGSPHISYEFMEPRTASAGFSAYEAAIFSEARSMVDWNARNRFCPACGSPTYSLWAGWKLACATLLPWADNTGKKPCPSARGLHNFSHPRTDPVVIMAIIDESGDRILLGKNRKFPFGFYSCLAGFIEPGESFEDAVKREIWEEAGVRVWGVKYHSTQPWPYPASLMVGFYAFADSSKPVRVDLDNELVDARWYTREEILNVLSHKKGSIITRQEQKIFDNHDIDKKPLNTDTNARANERSTDKQSTEMPQTVERPAEPEPEKMPAFRLPPATAIAGVLIRDWANGKIGAGGWNALKKGNL
ncbi:NPY1_1 [Sanghuangporus sanghuang]